jgi:5-formyltetrahydrofolate cyclo-ligase
MRARRLHGPASQEAADLAVRNLLALPELARARRYALYAALPDEVPAEGLRRLLTSRGLEVVLPRIERAELILHIVVPGSPLRPGALGVPEPDPALPVLPPGAIDAFVVPGLLFDRRGFRLGRGGAHYDRLLRLARSDALRVGLCYAERIVEALPVDPWDVPMNLIVTEAGVFRPAPERRAPEGAR